MGKNTKEPQMQHSMVGRADTWEPQGPGLLPNFAT